MYIKQIALIFLAFFSVALQTTPAAAAFSIEYQAPADPTTQGFSAFVSVPPAPQVFGPIANDLGYPAWSISGLGLSSQFGYLSGALTAAQRADINSQGFTLTLRGRVLQGNAPAFDAGYNTVIGWALLDTGSRRYDLVLGVNSSGNTVAVLVTYYDAAGPGGSTRGYGPTYALNDAGYHTYDLVFNPQTQSASLFIDGVERLSGYTGHTNYLNDYGLIFGATSGGGMNFNLVRLTSPAITRPHAIAHYTFDETGGTTAHDAVGSVDGTLEGGARFAPRAGIRGGAIMLDRATGDLVNMGDHFGFTSGSFSIETWVKLNPGDTDASVPVGRHWNYITAGYFLAINDVSDGCSAIGRAHLFAGYPCSGVSSIVVNDGQWHQLVGVYNSTNQTASIYVDGQFQSSSGGGTIFHPVSALFLVGGTTANGTPSSLYTGLIDEVRLYDQALSDTEVNQLYQEMTVICTEPPMDLVSWWPGDGSANDIAGPNNGIMQGAATFGAGIVGQAFVFDGSAGTEVRIPDNPSLNPSTAFTIEGWIKPNFAGRPAIFADVDILLAKTSLNTLAGYALGLAMDPGAGFAGTPGSLPLGTLVMQVVTDSMSLVTVYSPGVQVPNDGFFHHVAGTYDGSALRLFLDGQLVGGPVLLSGNIFYELQSSAKIGAYNSFNPLSTRPSRAAIDEVGFYNRALSPEEIAAIASAGSAGKCKSLDTEPPVLTLPEDFSVEATGPAGAVVTYTASAMDKVDGPITPICEPASGSTFPVGATTVTCSATDAAGNSASGGFTVTVVVVDTTPPVLNLPVDITVEATGPSGATVTYTTSATDDVDGPITPTCTPASGSPFPVGATTVTCSATDAAGNTASGGFTVTVVDTTPPVLDLPAAITAEATGPSGATVTFTASATDLVDGAITPVCTPNSGSTFGLSDTSVQCSATDAAGNSASGSFTVTVVDTTPPVLNLPVDITTEGTSASGAVVDYTASATDVVDGEITPTCTPASGSTFPVGATTVNCSATDQAGNTASGNFTVTVRDTIGGVLKTPSSYEFSLEQGTEETDSIQLINTGTVPRTATLEVLNPHSDLTVSLSQSTVSIGAGETQTLPINLDAGTTPAGLYDDLLLKVTADDGSTLYASIKVNVGTGPLPDLAITANDISSVTNADDSVTLTATVRNRGTAPASNVQVRFYEFDNPLGEPMIAEVAPNGIGNASITVPAMTAGDHLIRVVVDPEDAIAELDETNNEASRLISIGSAGPTEGNILVTGSLPATVYTQSLFTLNGRAVYDLYVNGVRNTDYVVKGGSVQITVAGDGGAQWVYGDVYTDVEGNFAKTLQAPATPGTYRITMTVTDKTFVGTRELVFIATDPPPPGALPPLQAPPAEWGAGYFEWDPVASQWVWTWTNLLLTGSVPQQDVFVYSKDIYFSKSNPAADEEITVFAAIRYWASNSALIAENVPVNVYATYPGTPRVKIGQTLLKSFSVGSPDFGARYVYATWKA